MERKQGKWIGFGIILILFLGVLFLVFYGERPDRKQEKSRNRAVSGIEKETVSETDMAEDVLIEEQDSLWVLFDNMKFSRKGIQPWVAVYTAILILYILIIGPGFYFVLKRKDKMEWLWFLIPVFSCAFSVLIWRSGENIRVKKPVVDALTVLSPNQRDVVYAASTSPGKQSYQFQFDGRVKDVWPLYMGGEHELYRDAYGNEKLPYQILRDEHHMTLHLSPGTAFSRDYFRLDLKEGRKKEFFMKMDSRDILPKGRIRNTTGYDFPYVFVYFQEQFCFFENVGKNDIMNIQKKDWQSVYNVIAAQPDETHEEDGDYQQMINFVYEKYLWDSRSGRIYIAGIMPDYEGVIDAEGKDLVSRGIFYQWIDLEQE